MCDCQCKGEQPKWTVVQGSVTVDPAAIKREIQRIEAARNVIYGRGA